MLSDAELLRYSRQVLLQQVDIEGQLALKNSTVLIVGLGGLGSPVALYLAAAGVGRLLLADFDRVDHTNLQRQILHSTETVEQLKTESAQARLRALNPEIVLHSIDQQLDADSLAAWVQQATIVLDCTDNFLIREQLNQVCIAQQTPWISGAAIRLHGQLTAFDPRVDNSPCYFCLYGAGDEQQLTCSEAGVLGPLVGTIGSLQALETIKQLVGFGRSMVGRLLLVDGLTTEFRELKVKRDPECPVCATTHGSLGVK
ncbi:molybdopterin-synthase adenylyltransferase MoeB [Thiopseudomonas alkaliphila]|uniref:Molybdopterin-synthase adenylyltransferase n=1 Tax=Thiopseudomonas alkaliphila TaxID=1697053 RepID=A0AAW7DSN6_9GAMM|nr:molybdopterin-synthase adenylyltransferase MoeB [Thiopseudomonas alkaliphila]MDM1696601.1 molybdopterin-synthase adenylyltransferase MoeB [Thiopseudomonas alkaliphila]